jgi:hypothetical protein
MTWNDRAMHFCLAGMNEGRKEGVVWRLRIAWASLWGTEIRGSKEREKVSDSADGQLREMHVKELGDKGDAWPMATRHVTYRVPHRYSTGRAGWHHTRTLRHCTLAGLGYTPYPFFQGVNVKLGFYINPGFLYYKQWKLLYIQLIKLSNSDSKRPNMP